MKRRPTGLRRTVVLLLVAAVLLAGGLVAVRLYDESHYVEPADTTTEGFGTLRTVEYEGATWREKPAVTTILLAGIDQTETSAQDRLSASRYRQGGQADFLMLMAIDHTDKKIHRLMIDRDTMTEVTILGVFGNESGTRVLQICLAHYFGATKEDNAKYTIKAVEKFLGGLDVDGYYMADYSVVSVLAETLGGVDVVVPDDMTPVDPGWTAGASVHLTGKNAESFVRSRMSVGDGTNVSRMKRQTVFLDSAMPQLRKMLSNDLSFSNTIIGALEPWAVTNFTRSWLISELNRAYRYEVLPADTLSGEHTIGKDGFVEFHAEAETPVRWVLEHLYTKVTEE